MSIDIIMGLGDDQMANNFVFTLPTGIPGGGNTDLITLRMEESFPMPEDGVGEYEIRYQGLIVLKTSNVETMDKHFTINVRVDSQWEVYDDLKNWKMNCHNNINGTFLSDLATRTTAVVQALDGQKNIVKTFTFKHTKLQKIKVTDFSHTEETPTKLELTFLFGYME